MRVHYDQQTQRNPVHWRNVNLTQRVWQHKSDLVEGFTKRYGTHTLVWYEIHDNMESAITREKRIKEWKRAWKMELISAFNPEWLDLYGSLE